MLRQFYFWSAVFWTLLVAYMCLTPSSNIPSFSILYLDKVAHFSFHFVFTILWILAFNNKKSINRLLIPFLLSVVFGIAIEIFQGLFTTTRCADVFDVFANIMGASLAVFMMKLFGKRK